MVDYQTAIQHLQQEKLALKYVVGSVGVVKFEDALVLLPHYQLALHHQLVRRHGAALFHLGGEVEARRTEQQGVNVPERVSGVEPLVVDDGRRDDLLS